MFNKIKYITKKLTFFQQYVFTLFHSSNRFSKTFIIIFHLLDHNCCCNYYKSVGTLGASLHLHLRLLCCNMVDCASDNSCSSAQLDLVAPSCLLTATYQLCYNPSAYQLHNLSNFPGGVQLPQFLQHRHVLPKIRTVIIKNKKICKEKLLCKLHLKPLPIC